VSGGFGPALHKNTKQNKMAVLRVADKGNVNADIAITRVAGSGATANGDVVKYTTAPLTTAANAIETITFNNSRAAASSAVVATINGGTNSQGVPVLLSAVAGAGSVQIQILNNDGVDPFDGTLEITVRLYAI
jgi:hypothetical protein